MSRIMDPVTGDSKEDGVDEVELRQLLVELQQLTKQQTSYTTVLQSLNERQSAVNDRLLQIGAAVESQQAWKKLKDVNLLQRENQSLRKNVDELTMAEQLFDARMTDLQSKLSEATSNSKKHLLSKQQLLKDIDVLRAKLDSSQLLQEQQQVELDRLKVSVEEITADKQCLQQKADQLTTDVEAISLLQREIAELNEKIATMERLQALRNLRELEDTAANEDTEKMLLELIQETTDANEGNKHSGWRSLCSNVC